MGERLQRLDRRSPVLLGAVREPRLDRPDRRVGALPLRGVGEDLAGARAEPAATATYWRADSSPPSRCVFDRPVERLNVASRPSTWNVRCPTW